MDWELLDLIFTSIYEQSHINIGTVCADSDYDRGDESVELKVFGFGRL